MFTVCCYHGCRNNSRQKRVAFYQFPRDTELAEKWAKLCRPNGSKKYEIQMFSAICQEHFHDNDIQLSVTGARSLDAQAVPMKCEEIDDRVSKRCVYSGCENLMDITNNAVSYFQFPTDPELFVEWSKVVQPGLIVDDTTYICSNHFYRRDTTTRLGPLAIPMPLSTSVSGEPTNTNWCSICKSDTATLDLQLSSEAADEARRILSQHYHKKDLNDILHICDSCWGVTRRFHNLYEMVQQSSIDKEKILHELLSNASIGYLNVEVLDDSETPNDDDLPTTTAYPVVDIQPSIEFLDIEHMTATLHTEIITANPTAVTAETNPPASHPSVAKVNSIQAINASPARSTRRRPKGIKITKITGEVNDRIRFVLKTLRCDLCPTVFASVANMTGHYRKEHSRPGYMRCCGVKFDTIKRLLIHIERMHENPNSFACAFCSFRSLTEGRMQRHLVVEHAVFGVFNEFSCDICGKVTSNKKFLNNHMWHTHISPEKLCHICAKSFRTQKAYEAHLNEHMNIPNVDKTRQCEICGKWVAKLLNHMDNVHGDMLTCTLCGTECRGKQSLKRHMLLKHRPPPAKYKCPLCCKQKSNSTKFREHMARHRGERPYACKYCPKTFRENGHFYSHRMMVHPEEYAKERGRANVLQQRTNGTKSIKEAVKKIAQQRITHLKQRYATARTTCGECGVEMLAKSLPKHILFKHNKEKYAHVCTVCNKSYPFQYMLQDHMTTHTKEERYTCNYCTETFCRYDAKFAHQKKAHLSKWLVDKQKREANFIRNQTVEADQDDDRSE